MVVNGSQEYEPMRLRVRRWLIEESAAIRDLSEPRNVWTMTAAPHETYGVAISMERGKPEQISFGTTLMLSDYASALDALSHVQRRRLGLDLRIHLSHFYQIGFDVPDSLEHIFVNTAVASEGLTKLRFFEAVYQVNKALASSTHVIDRFLLDVTSGE